MVPNITSGSSFYGVIAYNKIKVETVRQRYCDILKSRRILPAMCRLNTVYRLLNLTSH